MPSESRTLPVNGFVLPPNEAIAAALLVRFKDYIIGASFKMGVRYHLTPEDREDMRHAVYTKILSLDWRSIFRKNKLWIKHNMNHPSRNWSATDAAFVLKNYACTTIVNTLLWAAYYTKNHGMTGLGGDGNIFSIPQSESYSPTENADSVGLIENGECDGTRDGHGRPFVEPSSDGQADRTAAKQMCEIAEKILDPQEWECIRLQFGFDGGGNRTLAQVATDAGLPRKTAQQLLDSAMNKLKTHINR
jgi:hypothetical protein